MKPAVKYLKELKYDARPKLFGFAAPGPVRAQALIGLENRQPKDFLLRHAIKDCPTYEPRVHLLESWKEDGTWGTDRFYMRAHGEAAADDRAMVEAIKNLFLLDLYLWNDEEEEGYLEEFARNIIDRSCDDGFIQLISPEARWTKERDSSIYKSDHWGGFAIAMLVRYGFDDAAIDNFYHYLENTQRPDGGWLPEFFIKSVGEDFEGDALPSHPLHTYSYATALAINPKYSESSVFRKSVAFLLNSCFTDTCPYSRASGDRWYSLMLPDFGQSALNTLHLAAEAGVGKENAKVAEIMKWLRETQQKTGLWPTTSRKETIPDEALFLSLQATMAVKRISDDLESEQEDEGSAPRSQVDES